MTDGSSALETLALPRTVRVPQRSGDDCLLCSLAMFTGRTYEEIEAAARRIQPSYDPACMAFTHSLMRRIAHDLGFVLLSSIYMDWRAPAIIGTLSLTQEGCGHALYWDGETLHDPGPTDLYTRAFVDVGALEFTQRASDLAALIQLERTLPVAANASSLQEFA